MIDPHRTGTGTLGTPRQKGAAPVIPVDCPRCEGREFTFRRTVFSNGTTHIEVRCKACRHFVEWAKQTPAARAAVGRMPAAPFFGGS